MGMFSADEQWVGEHQHCKCNRFHLEDHFIRQNEFARKTFGPGKRTKGLIDHIKKELVEVEASDGSDLSEWIDIILLASDGALRGGAKPWQVCEALQAKLAINERRKWPDWRTADPSKAIEHDRSGE
jgi:hypothetical protein